MNLNSLLHGCVHIIHDRRFAELDIYRKCSTRNSKYGTITEKLSEPIRVHCCRSYKQTEIISSTDNLKVSIESEG